MKLFRAKKSPKTACPVLRSLRARLRHGAAAFSLTELVIAMGVATVAFTSIIGLFPLGLGMSKESYESTQAALLAKSFMSQLVDAQSGTGNTSWRRIIFSTGNDPMKNANLYSIDAGSYRGSTNVYLALTNYVDTNSGLVYWRPASNNPVNFATWTNGLANSPNCPALVRVTLSRISTNSYDIHNAEVQVDYPANLNITNRNRKHEIFSRICH